MIQQILEFLRKYWELIGVLGWFTLFAVVTWMNLHFVTRNEYQTMNEKQDARLSALEIQFVRANVISENMDKTLERILVKMDQPRPVYLQKEEP